MMVYASALVLITTLALLLSTTAQAWVLLPSHRPRARTTDPTRTPHTAAVIAAQSNWVRRLQHDLVAPPAFLTVSRLATAADSENAPASEEEEDGPELLRIDLADFDADKHYDQLAVYLREWAFMVAETPGQGLTTPVQAENVPAVISTAKKAAAVQLNFKPTATGKNYASKEDEREREKEQGGYAAPASTNVVERKMDHTDGGIEFVVEIANDNNKLQVRAKRCNYGEDAPIKEMSEEAILSMFKKSIDVWKKDHRNK